MTDIARLATALAGRYAIERELGQGGMAVVYLAHDVRHDRKVALKVLRPELSAIVGAERFLHEIKTTAHLQHPHILPLHDSGEAEGIVFYVMPYVEGESVRDRLSREKQLPVDDTVRIAAEVADALDYAHRHGVIHRDIKPENILLHDGHVVVADFGIALAVSTAGGGTRLTETGMSLGTPHYMAPEQAMGQKEITPKADIYALGCVVYEMLSGEPPFTGPTAQAIIARVVTEEPRSLTIQRKTVPSHVEQAVLTALAKLPADRFATATQFAEALSGRAPSVPLTAAPAAARSRTRPALSPATLAGAAAGLLALGILLGSFLTGGASSGVRPARLSVQIPSDHRLTSAPVGAMALSPDGGTLVYVGESARGLQLYVRRLDDLVAVPLAGTENGTWPLFSRDGEWVAFITGTQGRKIPLVGGAPIGLSLPQGFVPSVFSSPDEFLGNNSRGDLGRVRGGGPFELMAPRDSAAGEGGLIPLEVLPGGDILALALTQGTSGQLHVVDPGDGRRAQVAPMLVTGAWYADGYLAWVTPNGDLVAAPFDLRRKRLSGVQTTLASNVRVAPGAPPQVAVSSGRSLAYVPSLPFHLVRVDRNGRLETLTDEPRRYHSPRVSPDGRRIVADFADQVRDVWVLDLRDRTMTRVSFDNDGHDPIWAPDGASVVYASRRGSGVGIVRRRADGSGEAESLLVRGLQLTAHSISPDGRVAIAVALGPNGDFDLVTVPLVGQSRVEPLLDTRFNEFFPAISPDGRWLAYVSDESGRSEVYVRAFPGTGGRLLISQNGGTEPQWSRDGRELYYRDFEGPSLVAVSIVTRPVPRVESRTRLFSVSDYETAAPHANYDVTPDGKFIFVRQGRLSEIVYLQDWVELVRRQSRAAGG
jgi:serine/threonine-protein kinase